MEITMTTTRRSFLSKTATFTAGAAALGVTSPSRIRGANERFTLGIIGPGGRGAGLLSSFCEFTDVDFAWVCDVDSNRLASAAKTVERHKANAPKATKDMRRLFDDKSLDAVIIATPDHWHAPATILACDAGKHVYVEKPGSHNIREGRLMIEAARRNQRIVQVGTQSRSSGEIRDLMDRLHQGEIGDILSVRVWNSQKRRNVGHQPPSDPPANLDWDNWVGPAPKTPYQSNMIPAMWRWWHAFGTGDIGNDGVHDIDIAHWGQGTGNRHPNRVCALGGKYFFDDDQQFPDTQTVICEYDLEDGGKRQFIYEQRIWSPYVQQGHENGNDFYGTKGYVNFGKAKGWEMFGERNKPVGQGKCSPDSAAHARNFLDCIRSGQRPNADVEIHHYSASLAHLGNIATRLQRTLEFDPVKEQFRHDAEANQLVTREYRPGHWAVPKGV